MIGAIDVAVSFLGVLGFWGFLLSLMGVGVYIAIQRRHLPWHRDDYDCDYHCDDRCGDRRRADVEPYETALRKAA